ncbi:MAG: hypothetical protein IJK66_05105 [Bacilli bacterium]|nr:hypothetical protein [Bacilli bacterium]
MSLKKIILENEIILLNNMGEQYKNRINNFISKIKALDYDGDIARFLSSQYFLDQKREQYIAIHNSGLKTAVDILNDYDKSKLDYINIDKIEENDLLTAMNISALANNFNVQKGMYYNETNDFLIIKSQIKDGTYDNNWIVRNSQMKYYLETEKFADVYYNLQFSHLPNKICRDIIIGYNNHTKLFLFYRYNNGDRYFFAGQYKPIKFTDDNRAIIITKIDNKHA